MEQTWRWFGPEDKVTLQDALQAGAEAIVTALHNIPAGEVWPLQQIQERQAQIQAAGLQWSVVESLDVTEAIKTRQGGYQHDIDAFVLSLRNLALCGVRTVAYNLMPVFSWVRTHLHVPLPNGGFTTKFDANAFAAFDLFLLRRDGAEADWTAEQRRAAEIYLSVLSPSQQSELSATILQGLPGGSGAFSWEQVRVSISRYRDLNAEGLRSNAAEFLRVVCPVAQELGIRLCVHPDDPPRGLLGLPRIVSTADDLAFLMQQSPLGSNGITFCTGALGVRTDNNLVAMARQFAPRIGFAHLRSTRRDAVHVPGIESFYEAAHLEGDADVVGVLAVLLEEDRRRGAAGMQTPLPFRPDHGQELMGDAARGAAAGYPAVGRLRGLAELRGVLRATERWLPAS